MRLATAVRAVVRCLARSVSAPPSPSLSMDTKFHEVSGHLVLRPWFCLFWFSCSCSIHRRRGCRNCGKRGWGAWVVFRAPWERWVGGRASSTCISGSASLATWSRLASERVQTSPGQPSVEQLQPGKLAPCSKRVVLRWPGFCVKNVTLTPGQSEGRVGSCLG